MRTLKYHEQKLLKKVDFLQWKGDDNLREVKIVRRYRIQNREDYHKYNRLCGSITKVRRGGGLGDGRMEGARAREPGRAGRSRRYDAPRFVADSLSRRARARTHRS